VSFRLLLRSGLLRALLVLPALLLRAIILLAHLLRVWLLDTLMILPSLLLSALFLRALLRLDVLIALLLCLIRMLLRLAFVRMLVVLLRVTDCHYAEQQDRQQRCVHNSYSSHDLSFCPNLVLIDRSFVELAIRRVVDRLSD
jgi:hypothetical protein